MCALRQVSIELQSGDFSGSSVAATVMGVAQSFTQAAAVGLDPTAGAQARRGTGNRGTPGSTVAFALLYVHPAPATRGLSGRDEQTPGTGWRLTLARVRPETHSAATASGRDAEWQALWSGESDAAPLHPCLIEDVWRRVGR